MEVEHLISVNCELGEGPLWHPEEAVLYWVDIDGRCFHRYVLGTKTHKVFEVGQLIGALAFRESGGYVLATENSFAFWDETNGLQPVAEPEAGKTEARFNDGKVDRQGRFWAGTMTDDDDTSSLYRLDANHTVHTMESGVMIANGLGWSPDQKLMYFTDSPRRLIYVYDYDAPSGSIQNRRVFAKVPEDEGVPDGLTIDTEGCMWSAHWGGWKVSRYDPQGKVMEVIEMPVEFPTSCFFGGPDLSTLFITSARVP
ncbi:MAG: SMP-30/gluconolactonase/LRE family protein, partial [Anaerolineales bacterium]|nr:SMP-30/gluconolactonase/LRE family protein [Anaerolineales bacterium]